MGVLGRIRESLSRTKRQIVERFDEIVRLADAPERRSRPVDVDTIEALEEILITADVGVAASERIVNAVKRRSMQGQSLRDLVKEEIKAIFAAVDHSLVVEHSPKITLIVGVNGTGKTTTVGKLANLLRAEGKRPLICAADVARGTLSPWISPAPCMAARSTISCWPRSSASSTAATRRASTCRRI